MEIGAFSDSPIFIALVQTVRSARLVGSRICDVAKNVYETERNWSKDKMREMTTSEEEQKKATTSNYRFTARRTKGQKDEVIVTMVEHM